MKQYKLLQISWESKKFIYSNMTALFNSNCWFLEQSPYIFHWILLWNTLLEIYETLSPFDWLFNERISNIVHTMHQEFLLSAHALDNATSYQQWVWFSPFFVSVLEYISFLHDPCSSYLPHHGTDKRIYTLWWTTLYITYTQTNKC
jgi:hypothetical protein